MSVRHIQNTSHHKMHHRVLKTIEFIKCELCRLDSKPSRCNSLNMDVNKTDKFVNAKR